MRARLIGVGGDPWRKRGAYTIRPYAMDAHTPIRGDMGGAYCIRPFDYGLFLAQFVDEALEIAVTLESAREITLCRIDIVDRLEQIWMAGQ